MRAVPAKQDERFRSLKQLIKYHVREGVGIYCLMNSNQCSVQSGYTLMEIVIVVVILGFFAGVSLVNFGNTVERAKVAEAVHILQTLREAQEAYKQETGSYASSITDLGVSIQSSENFNSLSVSNSNPSALADITRSGYMGYTLRISQTGVITCIAGGWNCNQLGF